MSAPPPARAATPRDPTMTTPTARTTRKTTQQARPGPAVKLGKADQAAADVLQELRPGQSIELLKELHILTREGRLNQDSRRKLKQVYHLFQFIEKLLRELPDEGAHATLADHGAGKSYLGLLAVELLGFSRLVVIERDLQRIEACRVAGFRQIIAVIGDGHADSASVRLHEKLGFRHSGRLEGSGHKHGRWLDTVFMQLSLNGGAMVPPDPDSLPERRFRQSLGEK